MAEQDYPVTKEAPVIPREADGLWECECGGCLGFSKRFNYCPWCGKAVKWDAVG